MNEEVKNLIERIPALAPCSESIDRMIAMVAGAFKENRILFTCGNGGSAADADHICGEFLKGFLRRRPLDGKTKTKFSDSFGDEGSDIANKLQMGLRSISLLSHPGFCTAFCNDVDPDLVFAQQLWALGSPGDVLLAISTGGGATNVKKALMTARMMGIKSILLTGNKHGVCEQYADCVIAVPDNETFRIQELHLPVYHTLCAAVEAEFFDE